MGPLVKRAELQGIHDTRQLGAVGGPQDQVRSGRHIQVEVSHQAVQATIAHNVAHMIAQRLTRLALDLVGMSDHAVETVVEIDPLRRGLGTDSGYARQIVTGLAHQSSQLGVALGRDSVSILDLPGRHAPQSGHPLDRVEHGAVVRHRLEGVTVPGAYEDLHPLGLGRGRQRGENVVRLIARSRQGADVHRLQHFFDEPYLFDEGRRGLIAGALVLGVLLCAEGAAGQVECDSDVSRLLLFDQRQEHGDETVNRIGGLPGGCCEAVHRQGVEGPKGHGVSVDEEKTAGGLGGGTGRGGAHRASLRA